MSDAFYQALSMKCDSLPRASKVKAARWEFNKTVEQFSIPTFDGSYRHVEMAIREEITRLVSVFTNISKIWTVCLAKRKVMLAWGNEWVTINSVPNNFMMDSPTLDA